VGSSAGGHLVQMLGLVPTDAGLEGDGPWQEHASAVQAVASFCGVSDLAVLVRASRSDGSGAVREFLAGPEDQLEDRARRASPVTYVSPQSPPFLLVHGNKDGVVPYAQSEALARELTKAGNEDVTLVIVEGAEHNVYGFAQEENAARTIEFFRRTLL
jgi:dipeptidyl aminopeptidase/acylaminoacyl peptidase